jgi:UDP-N-acetylmuramyl pentapeptide phosphotransferase/UDP-N-acetylglucosamine-1-phosphate transferase
VPIAYLGNSGSHLLGALLVLDPIGRFALLLPALDLVRLSLVRLAAGSRPWVGDRRHLAHRLQRAGLSRVLVALILIAIAAPGVLGAAASRTVSEETTASVLVGPALWIGLLVSFLLFVAVVRFTPRIE